MRMIFVGVFLLANAAIAKAETTGNELHRFCEPRSALLDGYVSGVVDKATVDIAALYDLYRVTLNISDAVARTERDAHEFNKAAVVISQFCVPKGATRGQVTDVFCKYLKDNPAERQKNATKLMVTALNRVWPCKGDK